MMFDSPRKFVVHDALSGAADEAPRRRLPLAVACLLIALCAATARAQDYRLVVLADDLRWPWSLARLPDGDFLVTEREGRLLRVGESGQREVIRGTPETLFAGQGGYFDVVLHPAFEDNQLVYLSYAEGSESANGTAVFRAVLADGELRAGQRILRTAPDKTTPQHYGGRMLFLPDGTLLLTTGEGFEMREEAQSRESELGKVLRIDGDGNPKGIAAGRGSEGSRLWTLGHRNPQGIALNPANGTVFVHEHGPRGGDELNRLIAGGNFGWPAVTYGVDYSGALVSPFKRAQGIQDPIWTWTPSIAPSGMAWYDGSGFPRWRNSLLIGALVDREVRRLRILHGAVVGEEALFGELEQRIRDVRVFDDEIYLLTDAEQGQLIRVDPG